MLNYYHFYCLSTKNDVTLFFVFSQFPTRNDCLLLILIKAFTRKTFLLPLYCFLGEPIAVSVFDFSFITFGLYCSCVLIFRDLVYLYLILPRISVGACCQGDNFNTLCCVGLGCVGLSLMYSALTELPLVLD